MVGIVIVWSWRLGERGELCREQKDTVGSFAGRLQGTGALAYYSVIMSLCGMWTGNKSRRKSALGLGEIGNGLIWTDDNES